MQSKAVGRWLGYGIVVAGGLALCGCLFQSNRSQSDSSSTDTTPIGPPTTVSVRVVNDTSKPLDPQFYLGPDASGIASLFVPANKQTDFGVGHVGVLLAGTETSFTVDCSFLGLFGTQGGVFGDDLNNPTGRGKMIVLEVGASVHCGDQVVFTFRNQGEVLVTTYSVSAQGG